MRYNSSSEYHLSRISLHDTIILPLHGQQVPCRVETVPQWYKHHPGFSCTLKTPTGESVLFFHPIIERA